MAWVIINVVVVVVIMCIETLITPEQFAEVLCDDLELPTSQFVQPIASSIRQQCDQFTVDMIPEDEEDRRVIIKVSLWRSAGGDRNGRVCGGLGIVDGCG